MKELAQAIQQRRQGRAIAKVLPEITQMLTSFHEQVDLSLGRVKVELIGDAVEQWQTEQTVAASISEEDSPSIEEKYPQMKVLAALIKQRREIRGLLRNLAPIVDDIRERHEESSPQQEEVKLEGIPELAQTIRSFREQRSFVASGVMEQINELTAAIAHPHAPEVKLEGMKELAAAILNRKAEQAISEHLEVFEALKQETEQWMAQQPQLRVLSDLVQSLQPMATLEAEAVLKQLQGLEKQRPKPAPPIKHEVFWKPDYSGVERPGHLRQKHWQEMKASCIHPSLIADNVESVEGWDVAERLLEEKFLSLGAGQQVTKPMQRELHKYRHVMDGGGWWGKAGYNPQSLIVGDPTLDLRGCLKPDYPRQDLKQPIIPKRWSRSRLIRDGHKVIEASLIVELLKQGINPNKFMVYRPVKYENPVDQPRCFFLVEVRKDLAAKILAKHGVTPRPGENYWQTVIRENLPIVVVEGLKDTMASMSQGHITVGISGVNTFYRAKDNDKNRLLTRQLNPEFLPFCTEGRSITFAYDQDTKISSILNVRRDLVRSIELIEPYGVEVKVATWKPEQGKGPGDVIQQSGPKVYDRAIRTAIPPKRVKAIHYRTIYNRLAKQYPTDAAIFLSATQSGDINDGWRTLAQSNTGRKLKGPQLKQYLERVKSDADKLYQAQITAQQKKKKKRSR